MSTSVQVHGLPEPPEGLEVWRDFATHRDLVLEGAEWVTYQPHHSMGQQRIVARPKWEPKPGEEPAPLAVGDRVRVLETGRSGVVEEAFSDSGEPLFMVSTNNGEDFDNYSRCQLEKLPAEPAWTAPEWASGLGWMTQDEKSGWVRTHSAEPVCSPLGFWGCDREGVEIMALRVAEAKSLNLYPPHWDSLPASERCLKLGGGT